MFKIMDERRSYRQNVSRSAAMYLFRRQCVFCSLLVDHGKSGRRVIKLVSRPAHEGLSECLEGNNSQPSWPVKCASVKITYKAFHKNETTFAASIGLQEHEGLQSSSPTDAVHRTNSHSCDNKNGYNK